MATIQNMSQMQFDGFLMLLEQFDFEMSSFENTPEGRKAAAQYSIIYKLREDGDFETVYHAYMQYRVFRNKEHAGQSFGDYEKKLKDLREQCRLI